MGSVNVFILLFIVTVSGAVHQPLYAIIPTLGLYYLSYYKKARLQMSPLVSLYFYLLVTVVGFFIIQSIFTFEIRLYSIKGILRYLSYALFLFTVIHFKINKIELFFKYMAIFLVLSTPIAVFQFMETGRYQNFFSHANHLSHLIVITIYFVLRFSLFKTRMRWIVTILLLFTLLLTRTSGAILMVMLLGLHAFFSTKKISFLNKLIIVTGPILAVIYISINFAAKIKYQISTLEYLQWDFIMRRVNDFKPGGYGSFIWRVVYWLKIIFSFMTESLFKQWFGVGVDTMTKGNMPYDYMYTDPHNDFLKVLVEFGYVGLLMFLNFLRRIYVIM